MPTGYTVGIIDGTTETFQDFAKQCMRNFGATIHMRDESMDKPYESRIPSDYHKKRIQKAKKELEKAKKLTDGELIEMETKKLNESKEYNIKRIKEVKEANKRLNEYLSKAEAFTPPTKDHINIKEFMIVQIKKTIDYDGDYSYHEKELANIETKLKNKEELKRCTESNRWVEQLLDALSKK